MHSTPNYKILGRQLSENPDLGIPLALENLNDPECHRNDILSSTCYLAYRIFEGTYDNKDFVWGKIQECKLGWIPSIKVPEDALWFKSRWESSFDILEIYFRMIVLNESTPIQLIKKLAQSQHAINHPPQIVNVLRANAMYVLYQFAKQNIGEGVAQLDMAKETYRKSIQNYNMNTDTSAYEISEANMCLVLMFQFRTSIKKHIFYKEEFIESILARSLDNRSYGTYYKCLMKIFKE